jgi:hypothetical protein
LGSDIGNLPPTQIHHGPADQVVFPAESLHLEKLLVNAGKKKGIDYEIHLDYPGEGHGFKSTPAIDTSTRRSIDFSRSTSSKADPGWSGPGLCWASMPRR